MKKTVIVVEDDRGLREQIVAIIRNVPDIECLGAYGCAEDALPKIIASQPHVVLMDIKLPGMSGIQCTTAIKQAVPEVQVIMVTVYEESDRIFHALKAGASGYLIKTTAHDQLINAIRDVHHGGSPMSSTIARKVVRHFQSIGLSPTDSVNLTPREREVLELLAQGFIYKEIGDRMKIEGETVRGYVKLICQKMHVRNKVEAVVKHRAEYL